jgi:hypothetical protein
LVQAPSIFFHLRLIAKISLAVALSATLALVVGLTLVGAEGGDSYNALIRSHSLTGEYLGAAMLLAGLMLIAIAGVATWMIALYSSHRIAGPLYRFSQNLKLAAASDAAPMLELRKDDALLAQAAKVKLAVTGLREHYAAVRAAAGQAQAALAAGDAVNYADAIARLKALDAKVRI